MLTSSPASSYLWNNGATTQSITVTETGTFSVVVSNAGGCTAASSVFNVIASSVPTVAVNDLTLCAGDTAILTANGASSYLWSTGATGNSIVVSPSSSTTYTVTGTTSGCAAPPVSSQVTVNPSPVVTVNSPTICAGESVALMAEGADIYLWSTGAESNSIVVGPVSNAIYSVTGTTAGCTSAPAISQVTVNPLPVVDLGGDITLLQGQQIVLDAGAGLTYIWSTGATTQTITINAMGTYSVTVTNNAGCTASDSVVAMTTSAHSPVNDYKISASPNPASDLIYIKCEGSATTSVVLIDNLGRILLQDHSFAPDGSIRSLQLGQIPDGVYYLKVTGKDFSRTISIIHCSHE
jgi:hypothetical protein